MRFRLLLGFLLLVMVITACQGPPPTVIYIVVSPTPETTIVPVTEAVAPDMTTAEATTMETAPTTMAAQLPSATSTATMPETLATSTTAPSATPNLTLTPVPTDLPPNFPTPLVQPIQVAEQLFEHGRMFWLQPTDQIWVLKILGEGYGTWQIYQNDFKDGEPESDPSLVPPEGRYQPVRGFGKLWRESGNLRQELGWGVTPEFGYVSNYEYHAGGSVDANGNYTPGPGYHVLYSLAGEKFRFNEADGTWQLGN